MPKSKTRKGHGDGRAAYAKGHEQGIRCAIDALLDDLPEDTMLNENGEAICPACALEKLGYFELAALAGSVTHYLDETRPGSLRELRAVGAHHA